MLPNAAAGGFRERGERAWPLCRRAREVRYHRAMGNLFSYLVTDMGQAAPDMWAARASSWLCRWPWANCITSQSLSFPVCTMGPRTVVIKRLKVSLFQPSMEEVFILDKTGKTGYLAHVQRIFWESHLNKWWQIRKDELLIQSYGTMNIFIHLIF